MDWKLPIKFEFTGRDTPQRNHLAEVGLATIAARGRAIMSAAGIPKELRQKFWREAFQTSTYLDGLVLVDVNGVLKTRFEHWEGKLPSFTQHLRKWGEAGVVKLRTSTTPKIYDRGKVCMFVGYSHNHAGDTFRMWDPESKRVHLSRDIVWLNKMFFNKTPTSIDIPSMPKTNSTIRMKESENLESEENIDDNDSIEVNDEVNEDYEEEQINNQQKTTRSGRVVKLPGRFREEMENLLLEEVDKKFKKDESIELLCVGAGIGEGILHTGELHVLKYKDAMAGNDRDHWKKAIGEEHKRMVDNNVWEPVKIENLPSNAKLLSTTWAMKKKANGQYRARITARGFLQEDGIHYFSHSTAAPVANELTIKIALTLLTLANWKAQVIDVKGAFLKG